MKKSVKILMSMVLMVAILVVATNVFAVDPATLTGSSTTTFNNLGNRLIGMLQAIGSIAAVVVLIVLGIKYMMGSAEEKAEYKKTMIPYLIGAILIFAASQLAGMIYSFASTLSA